MNPLFRDLHTKFPWQNSSFAIWSVALIAVSIAHIVFVAWDKPRLTICLPLGVTVILLCIFSIGCRACTSRTLLPNLLVVCAHVMTLALHGVRFWASPNSDDDELIWKHRLSCFTPLMQLLCSHTALGLSYQALPMAASIVIPLTAYPDDFLLPIPLIFLVVSYMVTIVRTHSQIAQESPLRPISPSCRSSTETGIALQNSFNRDADRGFFARLFGGFFPASRSGPSFGDSSSRPNSIDLRRSTSGRVAPIGPEKPLANPRHSPRILAQPGDGTIADCEVGNIVRSIVGVGPEPHEDPRSSSEADRQTRVSYAGSGSPHLTSNESHQSFCRHDDLAGRPSSLRILRPLSTGTLHLHLPNTGTAASLSPKTTPSLQPSAHPLEQSMGSCLENTTASLVDTPNFRSFGLPTPSENAVLFGVPLETPTDSQGRAHTDSNGYRRMATEYASKCNMLLESCFELKKEARKAEEQLAAQTQLSHELQTKNSGLQTTLNEIQTAKQAADELLGQVQGESFELQARLTTLKQALEETNASKLKLDEQYQLQCQRSRDLQAKYTLLLSHFENTQSQLVSTSESLRAQSDSSKEIQLRYESLKEQQEERAAENARKTQPRLHNRTKLVHLVKSDDESDDEARSEVSQHSSFTNISHDMRTPLTTALTVLEIVLDEKSTLDAKDQRELLQQAWAALHTTIMLINNVLDSSKLKNASITPLAKEVNVRRLVANVLRPLEIQANVSQIELILLVKSKLPTNLICDGLLLQRILTNLVANALKFSIPNGRIVVSLDWSADRSLLTGTVYDNGSGMSPKELAALFRHFYQAKHGKGGTGLGLTICHQLIREMGGTIVADSEGKGKGSVFKFELPLTAGHHFQPSVDCSAIVIDDDPIRRESIEEMLRYVGVSITEYHSCNFPTSSTADFSDQWANFAPKLVFVSVTLESWQRAVGWWKAHHPDIPVTLVIPHTRIAKFAEPHPADFVLRSPFDMKELRTVLDNLTACGRSDTSHSDAGSPLLKVPSELGRTFSTNRDHTDMTLLLAEDNRVNHKLFLLQLRKLGIANVHSAYDGEEAVALAEKNKYTLIIMDCVMPKMDGYEATRRIRSLAKPNQDTPIVALTANHSNENAERCRGCGMMEFFTKPITPQMWESIVEMAVRNQNKKT